MTLHTYSYAQRSEAWYAARCGILTASAVGSLISINPPDAVTVDCPTCKAHAGNPCLSAAKKEPTPIKSLHDQRTEAASHLPPVYSPADNETSRNLIATLASERITGHVEDSYTSLDMFRGIIAEPFARDLYSEHHAPVVEVGFLVREFDGFKIGFSPDGLVDDDGLIEVKAPRAKNHLATIIANTVPLHYMAQCQTGLLVSGRAWIDYVSYCGGMPLWVKRVVPDPRWHDAILAAAAAAEHAITERVAAYMQAVTGLPLADRIDFNAVELKLS